MTPFERDIGERGEFQYLIEITGIEGFSRLIFRASRRYAWEPHTAVIDHKGKTRKFPQIGRQQFHVAGNKKADREANILGDVEQRIVCAVAEGGRFFESP